MLRHIFLVIKFFMRLRKGFIAIKKPKQTAWVLNWFANFLSIHTDQELCIVSGSPHPLQ